MSQNFHQQARIAKIKLRLPTVSTILPVSDNFQRQLDMLFRYPSENLTSIWSSEILVLLERKYRALPHFDLWERLFDMCVVYCYDEMVRDLCGISEEDWLTTDNTNSSTLASEERTTSANTNPSAETAVETINVHISVWNYSVKYKQLAICSFVSSV